MSLNHPKKVTELPGTEFLVPFLGELCLCVCVILLEPQLPLFFGEITSDIFLQHIKVFLNFNNKHFIELPNL